MSKTIKLSGWKAFVVVVGVVGFGLFRLSSQSAALETEGVEKVKHWILLEQARKALPEMEEAMEEPQANAKEIEAAANRLMKENFEILSIKRRGSSKEIVARVEVQYQENGGSPAVRVRYLRMRYGMATGWVVERETNKLSYYIAALSV